jgi:hypothetical protein
MNNNNSGLLVIGDIHYGFYSLFAAVVVQLFAVMFFRTIYQRKHTDLSGFNTQF